MLLLTLLLLYTVIIINDEVMAIDDHYINAKNYYYIIVIIILTLVIGLGLSYVPNYTDMQHANKNNSQHFTEQILVERVTPFTVVPSHCTGLEVFQLNDTHRQYLMHTQIHVHSLFLYRGAVGCRGRIN